MPQTNEYTSLAGVERHGNICSLKMLVNCVGGYIQHSDLSIDELKEIKELLSKVNLPLNEEKLYAYEIPYIIDYKKLIRNINAKIQSVETSE